MRRRRSCQSPLRAGSGRLAARVVAAAVAVLGAALALTPPSAQARPDATTATGTTAPTSASAAPTTPTGTTFDFRYAFAGSARLQSYLSGTVGLSGSLEVTVALPAATFEGELLVDPTRARLRALGFLPLDSDIVIETVGRVSGSLRGGKLRARGTARVRLPWVTLFGLPVAGGPDCRTRDITSIDLRSADPFFYPTRGGVVASTFALSPLVGCGLLTAALGPLARGDRNVITVGLQPTLAAEE